MAEFKRLKYYFDRELAVRLADKIRPVYPRFDRDAFVLSVESAVVDQELKMRVETIGDLLRQLLPSGYLEALHILRQILGPENERETGMFKEFYWLMPVALFTEKYGLDHFAESITMIEEITKRNTGEYAIRPYLVSYPVKTLAVMRRWSSDNNPHVRRLSSEGLRPRLPWAKRMNLFVGDPRPVVEILENLKSDSSAYVRKSVANNLADFLKENYEFTFSVLVDWSTDATDETGWIIRHALRNEIKKGNAAAGRLALKTRA